MNRQSKYWSCLGPLSTPRWSLRGGWRKIKWSQSATKDVERLWKAIRPDLDSLELALSLQGALNSATELKKLLALLQQVHTRLDSNDSRPQLDVPLSNVGQQLLVLNARIVGDHQLAANAARTQQHQLATLNAHMERMSAEQHQVRASQGMSVTTKSVQRRSDR